MSCLFSYQYFMGESDFTSLSERYIIHSREIKSFAIGRGKLVLGLDTDIHVFLCGQSQVLYFKIMALDTDIHISY